MANAVITENGTSLEVPTLSSVKTDIPQSTYRLQFNSQFKLADATAIIPYLHQLGITHCYASPLLTARKGSMHGYDIVDHGKLNPEVGTEEDFDRFCETLKAHQMGLIIDIVPNHMGVGNDNAWWMDVLENGRASRYANYFDIDWLPLKDELRGKVLLPVLGNQYGQILENGELELQFSFEQGTMTLHYYDHYWPINPNTYPFVLGNRLEVLKSRVGENEWPFLEYQSILKALSDLPQFTPYDESKIESRRRDKLVAMKHLVELYRKEPVVQTFMQELVDDFNALKNNSENTRRFHKLLESQSYRLAYWRVASDEINYRRFFDVNDLAGINMENSDVFQDTHQLLLKWVSEGKVSGFRIDHPDGLYDPSGYFSQLQIAADKTGKTNINTPFSDWPLYLVGEKIMASYEDIPSGWMIHGTSGYEFSNHLGGLFIHKANEEAFSKIYEEFTNIDEPVQRQIYRCKILIIKEVLSSELNVLANRLNKLSEKDWKTRDFTLNNLRRALAEVTAFFPVYRTYIRPDGVGKKDKEYIKWAVEAAKKRSHMLNPEIYDFIQRILTLDFEPYHDQDYLREATQFAMKFQQFTGPVMAKGLEDTCFYRYNRLISLNEVGGELNAFGTSITAFHYQNQGEQKVHPFRMLNTSTHDSKRSEDVRARISVLSEMPELWEKNLQRWSRINRSKKLLPDNPIPDANDEYFIYQTLLGIWPFEDNTSARAELKERLEQYFIKALRESKVHTSWLNTNVQYEEGVIKFVRALLSEEGTNSFLEDFLPFQNEIAFWGVVNSLSQVLLKLTVPGVPDIYQGCELWNLSLVDPDNRRSVNYQEASGLLSKLNQTSSNLTELLENYHDGKIKQFIMAMCLNYRRSNQALFHFGEYIPLEVTCHGHEHLVAFLRREGEKTIAVLAPRLAYTLTKGFLTWPMSAAIWKDTTLHLPTDMGFTSMRNIFTGETSPVASNGKISISSLLKTFPFGLFELS